MLRNHLILWFLGISACFLAETVAREAIIGGTKATVNQFPYIVSLQPLNPKREICGGGILNDYYVLTAANCVFALNKHFRTDLITVVAGTIDMKRTSEPAVLAQVKKMFVTKEYKPPISVIGDIAVLKLNQSLELNKNQHLKALKLPNTRFGSDNRKVAKFAGWGWTWIDKNDKDIIGGRNDTDLRFTEADVLTQSQCEEVYHNRKIPKKELCARVSQANHRRALCNGDTGGPLVYGETVIGVLGMPPKNCSEVSVVFFARVSQFLYFIENAMNNMDNARMRSHILI